MGLMPVCGALLQCSFGAAPTPMAILPDKKVLCCNMPAGCIQDSKPFVNILPFGMCSNPANPAVAAATAAAFGVLTPMPCIPATAAPWTPGNPKVLLGGVPALTQDSKLTCSFGGVISIQMSGQFTVLD